MKNKVTDFKPGDTVRVHQKIVEGSKERIQIFEGVVIKQRAGKNVNGTFTVRKISEGVGVERLFLVHSPRVTKIEVVKRGKVRRANLSYLRDLRGKKAKLKEKQFDSLVVNVVEESTTDKDTDNTGEQIDTDESVKISGLKKSEKISGEDDELDAEVTELDPADEEDEEKLKEKSTEDVAKEEAKESKKVHEKEEENTPDDETNLEEKEVEEGLDKAGDEDTKNQG